MIGETLADRYSILALLGEGGMGRVYEARHNGTGRRVAVKVITGDLAKNAGIISRFSVEAKAAGSIESQHIAQILDTGTDEARGMPFLVMEYLAGEDLRRLFHRLGVVPPALAVRLVAQACLGLGKAHGVKVIHRDIKPENMLLTERDGGDYIVKLLDFGIAKIKMDQAQSAEGGLTQTGSLLGTPRYMAPEQARGEKSIDHRADLWSLGIVLYQALSGHTPTDHIDAIGQLIITICTESPRPIQDAAPWVPADVAAVVDRALRIDRAERFQSADEMYRALRALSPGGVGIAEEMIVALTPEERAVVASKELPPPAPRASLASSVDLGGSTPAPGERSSRPSEPVAARPSQRGPGAGEKDQATATLAAESVDDTASTEKIPAAPPSGGARPAGAAQDTPAPVSQKTPAPVSQTAGGVSSRVGPAREGAISSRTVPSASLSPADAAAPRSRRMFVIAAAVVGVGIAAAAAVRLTGSHAPLPAPPTALTAQAEQAAAPPPASQTPPLDPAPPAVSAVVAPGSPADAPSAAATDAPSAAASAVVPAAAGSARAGASAAPRGKGPAPRPRPKYDPLKHM